MTTLLDLPVELLQKIFSHVPKQPTEHIWLLQDRSERFASAFAPHENQESLRFTCRTLYTALPSAREIKVHTNYFVPPKDVLFFVKGSLITDMELELNMQSDMSIPPDTFSRDAWEFHKLCSGFGPSIDWFLARLPNMEMLVLRFRRYTGVHDDQAQAIRTLVKRITVARQDLVLAGGPVRDWDSLVYTFVRKEDF